MNDFKGAKKIIRLPKIENREPLKTEKKETSLNLKDILKRRSVIEPLPISTGILGDLVLQNHISKKMKNFFDQNITES